MTDKAKTTGAVGTTIKFIIVQNEEIKQKRNGVKNNPSSTFSTHANKGI